MVQQRRLFIKNLGLIGAGTLVGAYLPGCKTVAANKNASNHFGLQLYTLRDEMQNNPANILKQVASFGYKQIESYEGPKGIFWDMENIAFKKQVEDLGMTIISSHCDILNDFQKKAEQAGAIGMKYLVCPWLGAQKTIDDYKRYAERFNQCGVICKQHGLRFAYHNHDYSFKKLEGQYPQDVLMQHTDGDLVDFEMDVYWVVAAAEDPIAWMNKYPGRFRLFHIKDKKGNSSVTLGKGSINFLPIIQKAKEQGIKNFFVEQEHYQNTSPLQATEDNAMFMRELLKSEK